MFFVVACYSTRTPVITRPGVVRYTGTVAINANTCRLFVCLFFRATFCEDYPSTTNTTLADSMRIRCARRRWASNSTHDDAPPRGHDANGRFVSYYDDYYYCGAFRLYWEVGIPRRTFQGGNAVNSEFDAGRTSPTPEYNWGHTVHAELLSFLRLFSDFRGTFPTRWSEFPTSEHNWNAPLLRNTDVVVRLRWMSWCHDPFSCFRTDDPRCTSQPVNTLLNKVSSLHISHAVQWAMYCTYPSLKQNHSPYYVVAPNLGWNIPLV